ncbi:hypothetical protein [Massilia sp. CCM 8734]|uniref:hypothetical protein n=1 Tax=Massilia sp. CCM 8734 TaxID=2609283 RepID=UPI00141F8B6C|nr:hypothetical protein [Massilia sp. CCM 8734]
MDTFNTAAECAKDRERVKEACGPKSVEKKNDDRNRHTGLKSQMRRIISKLDKVGQSIYGYRKDHPIENSWMDDHCDGMWIKPQLNGADDPKYKEDVDKFKEDLSGLGKTIDLFTENPEKLLKAGFDDLFHQAVQKYGKAGTLRIIAIDTFEGLVEAGIGNRAGPAARGVKWVAKGFDYYDKAQKISKVLGTESAKEVLDGMKMLTGHSREILEKLMAMWVEKPDVVMAELMSFNAEVNACLKARKCFFVPFKNNAKDKVSNGGGCCPGQTPHHVIPDSAVKNADCFQYKYDNAPTICLEGQDNLHGSHGRAHGKLDEAMTAINGIKKPPKPIAYESMRVHAVNAIRDSTEQCNPVCLAKQLDSYYKDCKNLLAKSGKGGAVPKEIVEDTLPPPPP